MINVVVEGFYATAFGPFPFAFLSLVTRLSGRKLWKNSKSVRFDATPGNIRLLRESEFELSWEDKTGDMAAIDELELLPTQHVPTPERRTKYFPKTPLRDYQLKALSLSHDRHSYAYLLEMGLGKTAIALANIGSLFVEGKITAALILAPDGVHAQWINEQIPEHFDPWIPIDAILWKGKRIEGEALGPRAQALTLLAMNTDAIRTVRGVETANELIARHRGKVILVIDESHMIKSGSSLRTIAAWALGEKVAYRRILTGTPISKNLLDAWAQFMFLDPRILGQRYMTAFRARYCYLGGYNGDTVVAHKNVEEFYRLIAPHSFRLTKAEAIDLPPKIYATRDYRMSAKTRKHYENLKATFMTQLDNGDIVEARTALVALGRLQQVVCGYLPDAEDNITRIDHDRLDQLMEIIHQVEGQVIIWARFTPDIIAIEELLNAEAGEKVAVTYYGETATTLRYEAVKEFISGQVRYFISNQASGGVGLNLQLGGCQTNIYYSNSFNALHRWQSEDRTHRLGTKGAVTYFDIVATASVDRVILKNLRAKKSLSDLSLDDIRQSIRDEDASRG
jgi:SNF2 family DNA or RNA helicase